MSLQEIDDSNGMLHFLHSSKRTYIQMCFLQAFTTALAFSIHNMLFIVGHSHFTRRIQLVLFVAKKEDVEKFPAFVACHSKPTTQPQTRHEVLIRLKIADTTAGIFIQHFIRNHPKSSFVCFLFFLC